MAGQRGAEQISIRTASMADAQALAELSGQLGYPSTEAQVEKRLRSIEGRAEHAVFVAEQNSTATPRSISKLLGFIDVFVLRTLESDARAEIAALGVDQNCRSRGLGRDLMGRAEDWARSQGCGAVTLRSNVIRSRAHTFYERLGYVQIKTQKAFRKHL